MLPSPRASSILAFPCTSRPSPGALPEQVDWRMYVSPAFSAKGTLVTDERRKRQRFSYPALVTVDGTPGRGRDLSAKGVSVLLTVPKVGDVVQVTLSKEVDGASEVSSPARVIRVDTSAEGYVLGLEFIE